MRGRVMISKYSDEQINFIREYAKNHTRSDVTKAFNQKFHTNLAVRTMKSTMANHRIKIGKRETANIKRLLTKEQEAFVISHYKGTPNKVLVNMINEKFGTRFTVRQIKSWKVNHDCNSGLTCQFQKGHVPINKGTKGVFNVGGNKTSFKKGNKPHNIQPVGTQTYRTDGYWWTKISEAEWRQTHRLVWEEAHGSIDDGQVLIFLDGDRDNITLENLELITEREHLKMNHDNYRFSNPNLTKAGIALTKTKLKINEKKNKNALNGGNR